MGFETKYLLRYGIPGWTLIIGVITSLVFSKQEILLELINKNTLTTVGLGAILALTC
ncbi:MULTISPECIES: hypothetical protein [Clostridia]|uniref:hypothetical protein n=1 Tax=Clostridia TaxID=186801 RepID=UPI0013140A10|nr:MULTISPECIES: hypothetical protein [Clostridia]